MLGYSGDRAVAMWCISTSVVGTGLTQLGGIESLAFAEAVTDELGILRLEWLS